jgi:hypothetical protein
MRETVIYCRSCGMPLKGVVDADHACEWYETCACFDHNEANDYSNEQYEEQLRDQATVDKIDAAMEKADQEMEYHHFRPDN